MCCLVLVWYFARIRGVTLTFTDPLVLRLISERDDHFPKMSPKINDFPTASDSTHDELEEQARERARLSWKQWPRLFESSPQKRERINWKPWQPPPLISNRRSTCRPAHPFVYQNNKNLIAARARFRCFPYLVKVHLRHRHREQSVASMSVALTTRKRRL